MDGWVDGGGAEGGEAEQSPDFEALMYPEKAVRTEGGRKERNEEDERREGSRRKRSS